MRVIFFSLTILCLSLVSCGSQETKQVPAQRLDAPWQLINGDSRLAFISVKKGTIAEVHRFTNLEGTILPDGTAKISIDLNSVETNIDIRNERVRTYLFETDKTPTAILTANIDMVQFASMDIGDGKYTDIPVSISMHGHTQAVEVFAIVTRLGENRVTVESYEPVIINVDAFALTDGVEKLRELANLPSITPDVPVSFSLMFWR